MKNFLFFERNVHAEIQATSTKNKNNEENKKVQKLSRCRETVILNICAKKEML